MSDAMAFPKTLDEFMEQYKIVDTEQVYTNGTELVPIFRIKQWEDAHPQHHERIFQEIVVEYPTHNTYSKYKGKPYFSINYTENGEGFNGFGTYNLEVLSEYLKEYFLPSVQPERKKGKWRHYDGMCSCSVCQSHMDDISPFCPMCGADMRGDEDAGKNI